MMHKCSNGRYLLITNIESVDKTLDSNWTPYAVLLTSWSIETATGSLWNSLIRLLLARGTKTFVCIGSYSEQLHDEIDEIIYEYDGEQGNVISEDTLTTYHVDESIEDTVNYFIHGTEFLEHDGVLLALVGASDGDVIECLKKD